MAKTKVLITGKNPFMIIGTFHPKIETQATLF